MAEKPDTKRDPIASGNPKANAPDHKGGNPVQNAEQWSGGSKGSKGSVTSADKFNQNSSSKS